MSSAQWLNQDGLRAAPIHRQSSTGQSAATPGSTINRKPRLDPFAAASTRPIPAVTNAAPNTTPSALYAVNRFASHSAAIRYAPNPARAPKYSTRESGGNIRRVFHDSIVMNIPTSRAAVAVAVLAALNGAYAQEAAPRHEIGLTLGNLFGASRAAGGTRLNLDGGVALQANYGHRFWQGREAALYGEVHLLASPLRDVSSSDPALTRDVATLFVTPGIRVKFLPRSRIAPYLAAGGGWADYQQSTTTLAGRPNPAPRTVNHAAFDYGAGADFRFWRFVALRAEIRDFYAGGPAYNSAAIRGGQHNVVAGGGLVLKFR